MAKYRVIAKTFINGRLIDPDVLPPEQCVVDYDGKPGSTLELVGKKRAAAAQPEGEQPEGEQPAGDDLT